jgi:acetoin:2,6-dichlorophenolindophenol oxidoreductase subunit beta
MNTPPTSPAARSLTLTYAQAAATALAAAMEADPRIVALGEDLVRGGVFGQCTLDGAPLQQSFGADRSIDTPISEANIMGAAVGLALAGLKPVVEMRMIDFALCAMDELVNQAAKNRCMFGGQGRVPLVARLPIGVWTASAAQHSQSLEAWFAHLPGVVVACPATPQDNHGLLASSLTCGDPVVYLEHKELWSIHGKVDPGTAVPLGRARVARGGGRGRPADGKKVQALGVTVTRQTPAEREAFVNATRRVHAQWKGTIGPDLVNTAQAAIAVRK